MQSKVGLSSGPITRNFSVLASPEDTQVAIPQVAKRQPRRKANYDHAYREKGLGDIMVGKDVGQCIPPI